MLKFKLNLKLGGKMDYGYIEQLLEDLVIKKSAIKVAILKAIVRTGDIVYCFGIAVKSFKATLDVYDRVYIFRMVQGLVLLGLRMGKFICGLCLIYRIGVICIDLW
jgi:hypothetical protein